MPTDPALASRRPAPPRNPRSGGRGRRAPADGGFSLIEALVALAVISIVMAGTAPFLVRSLSVVAQERTEQVATETANDALERIRALDPSSLLAGRGLTAAENQLAAAPTAAQNAFAHTQIAGDPLLTAPAEAVLGDDAPLPTKARTVTVGGVDYQQHWYVGRCWQVKADAALLIAVLDDCVEADPTKPGVVAVQFFRVVVAVTWQHSACVKPVPQPGRPADECVYVASTLVNAAADPVFDLKRPPPTIIGPDNQAGYVNLPVNFKLFASGGTLPRKWTVTGLPAGLTLSPDSGVITGKPTTAGTYPITVDVADRDGRTDDAAFTWIVVLPLALATPSTQTSRTGTPASLSVVVTGGLQPMTWSATGLPAGLLIDSSTGVISGVPTTVETRTVKVTAVDHGLQTKSVSFSWRVLTPVTLAAASLVVTSDPGSYNLASLAGGGLAPYTWKATSLPSGMLLDAKTGVAGVAVKAAGTRYLSTLEVTDAAGGKATSILVINVTAGSATDLRVTAPDPAGPNQNTAVGTTVTLTATAAGTSGYRWTATGLPPGLTINSAGTLTGRPTTAGAFVGTLTVTDAGNQLAKLMFVWTVTP